MGVVGGGVSLTYCWSYHCVDITCYPVAQPYLHQLGKWKLHYRSNSLQRDHLCRTTIVRLSPGRVLLYSSLLTSQCPTYPWDMGSVGPPGPDLVQWWRDATWGQTETGLAAIAQTWAHWAALWNSHHKKLNYSILLSLNTPARAMKQVTPSLAF